MNGDLKGKVVNGLFWQIMQRGLLQVISFAVSVVLARKLMPEDFGLVALSGMFITLIGIFVDSGLGTALVQKKNADVLDYNTVFFANVTFSIVIYLVIFFAAPWIAYIFNKPLLTPIIRVSAIGMPIGALSGVQGAMISKDMAFRKFFFSTLSGSLLSAVVGLSMVMLGCGVWSLVGQGLVSTIANTVVLIYIAHWRPKWMFSIERFKCLFSFGWRIQAAGLIGTFFYQLKGYAIGLRYTASDLAYYNRGEGVPGIFYNNINGAVNTVLFPALTRLQDDKDAVRRALSKSMRTTSFILMPCLLGLAAVSDNLVNILYTSKWSAAVPFMQIVCLMNCTDILGAANLQALKATGHADTLLKLEVYKKPLMLAILVGCAFISPLAIAIGQWIYSLIALAINAYPNKKYIGYPLKDQFMDVGRSFLLAALMAAFVFAIGRVQTNIYLIFTIQIICGILIYTILGRTFDRSNYDIVLELVKSKIFGKFKPLLSNFKQ